MAATTQELVYDVATESIRNQRDRLGGLHTRAATLLSAAALVTSFLGAQALDDTRLLSGASQPTADYSLQAWELVAIVFFILAAAGAITLLWPWRKWEAHLNAKKLIQDYVEGKPPATLPEMQRDLALHLRKHYEENEEALDWRFNVLRLTATALAIEVLAWLIDFL